MSDPRRFSELRGFFVQQERIQQQLHQKQQHQKLRRQQLQSSPSSSSASPSLSPSATISDARLSGKEISVGSILSHLSHTVYIMSCMLIIVVESARLKFEQQAGKPPPRQSNPMIQNPTVRISTATQSPTSASQPLPPSSLKSSPPPPILDSSVMPPVAPNVLISFQGGPLFHFSSCFVSP